MASKIFLVVNVVVFAAFLVTLLHISVRGIRPWHKIAVPMLGLALLAMSDKIKIVYGFIGVILSLLAVKTKKKQNAMD